MKRGRLVLAAVVAVLVVVGPAEAAIDWRPCGRGVGCATLPVPLDRSGGLRAEVALDVARLPARGGPRRGVTLLLAGGPGEAALSAFDPAQWRRYTPRSDIVSFDQRGTGGSGLLRCRDLESASSLDSTREAEACAVLLGRQRGFYRTSDSVADIEALRVALGAQRLTLVGVSYGTYLAQAYAAAYPTRVERMVLDSVVDVTGVDPLYRDALGAVPRVLERLCRPGCGPFTRDPVADVRRLVRRLAEEPARGYLVGQRGTRRKASLTRQDLLFTLLAGDVDPLSRAQFPAAVSSALAGDFAPLLRLRRRSLGSQGGGDARSFSPAVLAATSCEELAFPWPRFGPIDARPAAAAAAAAALPPLGFAPFDAATAAGSDLIRLCRRWPTASPAPAALAAPPDVPVLLLSGEDDLRTPAEAARTAAARYPRAELVVVPGVGHSVLASADTPCPERVLIRFLRGRELPRCRRPAREYEVTRPLPRSLREVTPLAPLRGASGRLAGALELTLADTSYELLAGVSDPLALLSGRRVVIPGLRGGRLILEITATKRKLRVALILDRLEVVPGVRISGQIRGSDDGARGKLRIRTATGTGGVLRLRDERYAGQLAGQQVSFTLPGDATEPATGAAAVADAARFPSASDQPRLRIPRG